VFSQDFKTCQNPPVAWAGGLTAFGVVRVMAGIVLPAITIPLTFVLLPDKPLAEKYEHPKDDEVELTAVSGAHDGTISTMPIGESPMIQRSMSSIAGAVKGGSRII